MAQKEAYEGNGVAESVPEPKSFRESGEGAEDLRCPITYKPWEFGEDLQRGVGQNPSAEICKNLLTNYRKHLTAVLANKGFFTK